MDLEKFVKRGQDAQTAVNKILSEAEVAMIRRQNASDQEKTGRAIAIADHQGEQLPSAHAPVGELLASIDQAVAVLRKYPDSPDLQYCVGYLEGFKELLAGAAAERNGIRANNDGHQYADSCPCDRCRKFRGG